MGARLPRLPRLEELSRMLAQVLGLIREIEASRLLFRLEAEDRERWGLVANALRSAQAPGMAGSVANVRGIVASALEDA